MLIFLDLVISFLVLLILMAGYRFTPAATIVFVPIFALYVIFVAVGAGFLLSALNVRYRDVRYADSTFLNSAVAVCNSGRVPVFRRWFPVPFAFCAQPGWWQVSRAFVR